MSALTEFICPLPTPLRNPLAFIAGRVQFPCSTTCNAYMCVPWCVCVCVAQTNLCRATC